MASRVDQSGFAPEETGPDLGFAVTPDGTASPRAGSLLQRENVVALPYRAEILIQQCVAESKTSQTANSTCLRVSKPQTIPMALNWRSICAEVDGVDSEGQVSR